VRVTIRDGKSKKKTKMDVPRLDAVVVYKQGPAEMYFRRTGQYEYTAMSPTETGMLHLWLRENKVNPWEVTLAQVDEALKEEREKTNGNT
jgi:hypothetical protein